MRTRHLLAMCVLSALATCGLLGMAANEPGQTEQRAVAPRAQPEDKVHWEWLAKIVKETETIKIGMSREDVEKILVEDVGGCFNPKATRYQHPRCPYVKLDLEFELATSGDRKGDTIAKRSVLLLDLIPNRARW